MRNRNYRGRGRGRNYKPRTANTDENENLLDRLSTMTPQEAKKTPFTKTPSKATQKLKTRIKQTPDGFKCIILIEKDSQDNIIPTS